mmetsp:Transcript_57387/g.186034  ORF Transcript_57387/g.186034 Transcript_57387/m.186034 type:complete len:246 (+) Transcript_57387:69-806(+)
MADRLLHIHVIEARGLPSCRKMFGGEKDVHVAVELDGIGACYPHLFFPSFGAHFVVLALPAFRQAALQVWCSPCTPARDLELADAAPCSSRHSAALLLGEEARHGEQHLGCGLFLAPKCSTQSVHGLVSVHAGRLHAGRWWNAACPGEMGRQHRGRAPGRACEPCRNEDAWRVLQQSGAQPCHSVGGASVWKLSDESSIRLLVRRPRRARRVVKPRGNSELELGCAWRVGKLRVSEAFVVARPVE